MRILFINMSLEGHHKKYINCLASQGKIEPHIIMEKEDKTVVGIHHIINNIEFGTKNPVVHLKWMRSVKRVVNEIQPDIIHFVWGDSFYCMMGFGFLWIRKRQAIITFHQVRKSILHRISLKIYSKLFKSIVVHTSSLENELVKMKIKNVEQIEYPRFEPKRTYDKNQALKLLGLENCKCPILLALGGTRYDKGLDILISALRYVTEPFHLLIAGKEQDITMEQIEIGISSYKDNVSCFLRYLSDEELDLLVNASDILVLPYRKIFDGASGPLTDGVVYGKMIIGPSHGSLNDIIMKNHLGLVFQTENVEDLRKIISQALSDNFVYDEYAKDYQSKLCISSFLYKYYNIYEKIVNEHK